MNKQTLALLALLLALSANTFAAAPKCYSSHGGYCQYRGKVSQIYINRYNLILQLPHQNRQKQGLVSTIVLRPLMPLKKTLNLPSCFTQPP